MACMYSAIHNCLTMHSKPNLRYTGWGILVHLPSLPFTRVRENTTNVPVCICRDSLIHSLDHFNKYTCLVVLCFFMVDSGVGDPSMVTLTNSKEHATTPRVS